MSTWNQHSYIVTGGSGYIASFVIDELLLQGKQVVVPWRTTKPGALAHCADRITWVQGDLTDTDFCDQLVNQGDIVLHFASFRKNVAFHTEHAAEVIALNTQMSQNIHDACKKAGGKPVVFCSSLLASTKNRLGRDADGYVQAKIHCEELWNTYGTQTGQPVLILRPANTYGPREPISITGNMIPALIAKCQQYDELSVWGSGVQARPFLFAPDIAKALMLLWQVDATGTVEVHPNVTSSVRSIAEAIVQCVQPDLPIVYDTSKPDGGAIVHMEPLPKVLQTMQWTDLEAGLKQIISELN